MCAADGAHARFGQPEVADLPRLDEFLDGAGDGDIRANLPRFTTEARAANQALVDLLGRIADDKGATPARIALAWLLAQRPWIVPIPGTRRLERLDENLGAVAVDLTTEDLATIDAAAADITVQGDRYPEAMQRMIDR